MREEINTSVTIADNVSESRKGAYRIILDQIAELQVKYLHLKFEKIVCKLTIIKFIIEAALALLV